MDYTFKSARLGFRNWTVQDVEPLYFMCSDADVMEFFPSTYTLQQTKDFIQRMQQSFSLNGYCYFAVDILETKEFIGFIGLSLQTFEADFTPCIDIGWRLKKTTWEKGYATEGAKACLDFGFHQINLKSIVAMAPLLNSKSQHVMEKIGMQRQLTFLHPKIEQGHPLQECVLYKIS